MLPSKEVTSFSSVGLRRITFFVLSLCLVLGTASLSEAKGRVLTSLDTCGMNDRAMPSNVRAHAMHSKLLDKQLCYLVILPKEGFDPGKKYRTLVLLHGLQGAPSEWIKAARFHEVAMEMMEQERILPFITVIPAGLYGYWTDWPDGKNPYATLVTDEYLKAAEELYPLQEGAENRAIAGVSMGGFGALSIGLLNPDTFGFMAAMSPTDMEMALKASPKRRLYLNVIGDPVTHKGLSASNPFHLVRAGAGAAQVFYLSYGTSEAAKFSDGTNRLYEAMLSQKRRANLRKIKDGRHRWSTWNGMTQKWWLEGLANYWAVNASSSSQQ
jgi:S-formylglutathione hydrolase FrmB